MKVSCLLLVVTVLLVYKPTDAFIGCRNLITKRNNIDRLLPANWNAFGLTKRYGEYRRVLSLSSNDDKEGTVVESSYLIAVAVILVAIVYDLFFMHGGVFFWADLKETMEGPLID